MSTTTAPRRARTVERRISALFATFKSDELGADGRRVEVLRTVDRGQVVTLSLGEAARLDALGALAAPGASAADIDAAIAATYAAYQGERRAIGPGA